MQIELVTSTPGFDALEADWRALESLSARNSVFLGWDWQRLWWTHYAQGRQLRLLVARAGGRVVGILPLCLQTHRVARVILVRKLRPIGSGGDTAPDDLGMLFDPCCEHAVARAFVNHLLNCSAGWQLLDLVDLPSDSALADDLCEQASQQPALVQHTAANRIPYADLPSNWESYLKALSRDRRQALARYRRKFEQLPGSRFDRVKQAQDIDPAFDRLVALHTLRWQGRTEELSFSSAQYLGFHRALMHALHASGRLRLYALELETGTVAMLYGFRSGDTFYHFQGGFDPAHAALSPGQLLMSYVIEQAIAEGCTVFDTLKGDYGHKRHFFQQTRQTVGFRIYRPGLIHWLYRIKAWRESRRSIAPQSAQDDDAMAQVSSSPTVASPGS